MDRVGNSVDRALLLAELLRAAGHDARLASATLTDEQARVLRERLGRSSPVPNRSADESAEWDKALDKEAAVEGVDPAQFRRDVAALAAPVNRMAEELAQRVAEQVPTLTAAVQDGAAKRAPEDPTARELSALREHWWPQLRQGGSWVDLDPMPPDGKASPPATRTVMLDRDPRRLPLPASDCHEITIRVIAEQWKDGTLREAPALQHTFRPAEVLGQRVTLSHVPLDWPADLNLASADAPEARLRETLLAQNEWVPALQVGDTTVMQSGVTTSGTIDPKPALDALAKAGASTAGAAKRVTSIFEDLPGGGAGGAKKADGGGVWTAEWIEYETRRPGSEPVVVRRPLFDLVGPAARQAAKGAVAEPAVGDAQKLDRALAEFSGVEILALPCRPTAAFVQHEIDDNLLSTRPALRDLLKAGAAGDMTAAEKKVTGLAPMPAAPYLFSVARSQWSRVRDRTFVDRPTLVAFIRRLAVGGPTGLVRRVVFDIVANPVQVRPGQAAGPDAFAARLEQGVVDSNLETLLARDDAPAVGAADLYRRSASQGVQWVALRPGAAGTAPDWARVQVPENERALIARDLAAGQVAVVPVRPVEANGKPCVGWWRVDPVSGETLAMTEAGGADAVEYPMVVRLIVAAAVGEWTYIGCGGATAKGLKKLGCVCCAAAAAALVMVAFAGAAAGAGATGFVGFMGTGNGVAAGGGMSIACNAVSGLMGN
jgi:hypothetical protein